MKRWSLRLLVVALLAAVALLFVETAQLAECLGRAEIEAHAARERAEGLQQELTRLAPKPQADPPPVAGPTQETSPVDLDDYTQLQLELHTTKDQLAAVTRLLEQRNAELAARAAESERRARELLRPIPGGVRLCLEALQDCLRIEGYERQRFLRAAALDEDGLHDVEMLDAAEDGLGVAFLAAARMTATVDRAIGRLTLRFFEGTRTVDGERAELPEDGFAVVFDEIDGRMFEQRLPYLAVGDGAYPADPVAGAGRDDGIDTNTRRQWVARIERLLSMARTELHWRPTRLRGLRDGQFLTVDLIGTNDRHHVVESAHCEQLAVEVDRARGVVSLLLRDGVLRRGGIESPIRNDGYRMLLPGVTPKQATDAMFGMVLGR